MRAPPEGSAPRGGAALAPRAAGTRARRSRPFRRRRARDGASPKMADNLPTEFDVVVVGTGTGRAGRGGQRRALAHTPARRGCGGTRCPAEGRQRPLGRASRACEWLLRYLRGHPRPASRALAAVGLLLTLQYPDLLTSGVVAEGRVGLALGGDCQDPRPQGSCPTPEIGAPLVPQKAVSDCLCLPWQPLFPKYHPAGQVCFFLQGK